MEFYQFNDVSLKLYNFQLYNFINYNGLVAQLVEQFPFKEEVLGSNPSEITRKNLNYTEVFLFY